MMDVNPDLLQWFINFWKKKSSCGGFKSETTPDQQFSKKLYKLIIRNSEKVYLFFKDSVWCADLADVQWISKFSKGFRFHYPLLMFIVNNHVLLFWKLNKVL